MASTIPSPDLKDHRDLLPNRQQKVHRELICTLCGDFLQDPKMLLCAHSFCAKCLSSFLPKTVESESHHEMKIECPNCFQTTRLQGFDDLSSPSKLSEMIELLSDHEKECTRSALQKRKSELAKVENDSSLLATSNCPEHGQLIDYYCDDCQKIVCGTCVLEEHSKHSCDKSVKFLVGDIAHLESLIQPAFQFTSRAEEAVNQLTQDYEAIEANRGICAETVREVFNQVRSVIDQREQAILSTIDKYIETKLSHVERQSQNLSEKKERILKATATTESLVDELYTVQILAEKEALTDELDQQEQGVLDIEEELFESKFSSTYIGFKNDSIAKIKKEISSLISLCEFYPDSDSGYYLSRPVQVGEDDPYIKTTEAQKKAEILRQRRPLSYSKSFQEVRMKVPVVDSIKEMSEGSEDEEEKPSCHSLSRRHSTPAEINRSPTPEFVFSLPLPPVPIRFDSLLAPTPILEPTKIFNKLSRTKTEVVHPCGICIGENNSIVFSDVKNHCLRIVASNGKFIDTIGKEGKGSCEFEEPCALAVDKNMHLLVVQRENPRLQKLTSSGKYLSKFGQKSLRGFSLGEPWGVAIGPDKKILVTDWDRNCIHIFNGNGKYDKTLDDENMEMLGDSLRLPAGIAVESEGSVLVADRGNHCIWRLQQNGSVLLKIGTKGHGPGELYLPYGVATFKDGSIAVSESGNNRISIFSPSGSFLKHFGRRGVEPGMFNHPRHMCVTNQNELIVADELNQRLQLFKF